MDDTTSTAHLLNRCRAGDRDAAALLFERYAQQLIGVARQNLHRKIAGRMDPEDVVQSVFRTFFRRLDHGEFSVQRSNQLWGLLVRITVLKTRTKARRHTAPIRDVRLEAAAGLEPAFLESLVEDPGPAEAVELMDVIENAMAGFADDYRQVLELRLAGYSVADVAEQLDLSRQTIYRIQDRLRERFEGMLTDLSVEEVAEKK